MGSGKGEGSGAEVSVGLPLDGQGYGVRPACVARAKGVWEEEGQGTVTGTGAASWYGVLTSRHTLGFPRSDSSPIRCRGTGQATQTPKSGPLVGKNFITSPGQVATCPAPCSGSGKLGPESCMASDPDS